MVRTSGIPVASGEAKRISSKLRRKDSRVGVQLGEIRAGRNKIPGKKDDISKRKCINNEGKVKVPAVNHGASPWLVARVSERTIAERSA